jgi:Fe-S cluster assembly ATP-binding protein
MLEIKDLHVAVEGKEILHGINLTIPDGETAVLFGPNGGGKTTLLMTIMGFPRYQVTRGKLLFGGKDITYLPIDERARLGIGISFQRPPVVRGVKTRDMVTAALRGRGDAETVDGLAVAADMGEFLSRDINYGFSGGETKRSELLQLLAQRPELTLLDEPESGVDLVNIALIGKLINTILQKDCPAKDRTASGLIITHTGHILEYVSARTGYVMGDGTLYCEGDPHEILRSIKEKGYQGCVACLLREKEP